MGKRSRHRTNHQPAALREEEKLNRPPDVALSEAVEELIQSLIELFEPHSAEILIRDEFYRQSPRAIASQLGMQQRTVNAELKKGRRAILSLINQTLQSTDPV